MQRQPSQRFSEYTQIIKNHQVVGFKLDNNDFEFLFDKNGGWFDEEGKYYNADAIECDPPESESDSESQPQQKSKEQGKVSDQMLKLTVREDNDLVDIKRELASIVESYPEGKQIRIVVSLQPTQQNEDQIIQEFLQKKFSEDLQVEGGLVMGVFNEQLANQIIELEGTVFDHLPAKPNVYVDVELYDSLEISFGMSKVKIQKIFEDLKFEKNVEFANLDEKQEDGKPRTYVEIRRDIEDQLWEENLEFRVENQ